MTAATSRIETQRRAAVALLAFVVVAGSLGVAVYAFGGPKAPGEAVKSLTVAQRAYDAAKAALDQVTGPGVDLVTDDPRRALQLLTTAYEQLRVAASNGYPAGEVAELRTETIGGLDRLYGVVPVRSSALFVFKAGTAVRLTALVRGPDGAPYVLDTASKTVFRIDLAKKTATAVAKAGQRVEGGGTIATPRFLTTGGRDVLVLDSKNQLYRWRPANASGRGTLRRIPIVDSSTWGNDVQDIATFVANFAADFYKLYIVDPSEQNIMVLSPANDGSGYPVRPIPRLPADRPVEGITDLLIDGDIYVAENGSVARVIPAQGWEPQLPQDEVLRPTSRYTEIATPTELRRTGLLYAFDDENDRIVAFSKGDGSYQGQYRLAGGDTGWADLQGFVVLPSLGEGAPATVWWISRTGLHSAPLEAVPDVAPSPSPSASAQPSKAPASPRKTPKP